MQERCRLISESQWREYLELVTKCHRLEKQLDVATKALELYSKDDFYTKGGGRYENPNPMIARQALKEIDLVGTSTKESK